MFESDRVKKRLMKINESTLEWIGTFFFIGGFLGIIILFKYVDETDPSVFRTMVWGVMLFFGAIYSVFFLGALGSFFPKPEDNKTIFDEIKSIKFIRDHQRIELVVKFIIGLIAYWLIFQTAIIYLMWLYDLLLFSAQISDIIVAILVAILIEQFFQLLGIGFKNIIQYQEVSVPTIIQEET